MLIPPGPIRVLVATKPVDFRKGMDGLAALVKEQLKADPFSGVIFCFRSKRADRVKLIFWDGTGLCLFAKRLEGGKFRWPHRGRRDAAVGGAIGEHLIKSGLPTEAMVASVLVAKYGWHLPLYRQAKMLASQGIELDRSTLAFWVGYAAAELMPLYERLKANLLASAKLAVDETPVPVLDPGRGKTKTGYFWAIARDDRPWGGTDPPAVVYTYAPGRGGEHLEKLLANYRGIVQCDGYAPYKKLPADRITVAFCWSHLRREFFKIAERGDAPIATEAVARIAQIYAIEKDVRGTSADERRAARQARSRPLIDALKIFFEHQLTRLAGGSDTARIIRYGLRHRNGLTRFLDDGRIELDTNIVERSMRPQALTRKNALFAGHDDGAENWAILASLIETCKLNGIEPQAYLADVLVRLVNLWPNNRRDELLPWTWAATREQQQRAA